MSLQVHKRPIFMEAEKCLRVKIYWDMNDPSAMKRHREMMPPGDVTWLEYNQESGWKYCQFQNPSILCGQHSLLLPSVSRCWVWTSRQSDNFIQILSVNGTLKILATQGNTDLYWKNGLSHQLSLLFFLRLQWRNTWIKQNTLLGHLSDNI